MIRTSKKKLDRRAEENKILHAAIQQCRARDQNAVINGRRLNDMCLACFYKVETLSGDSLSQQAAEYNHAIPRSRLVGKRFWTDLHSPRNLVGACREHHHAYDRRPELWLLLLQLAFGYDYSNAPFAYYLDKGREEWLTRIKT